MKQTWVHTHLPRLSRGDLDCLSVKIPGEKIAYASDVLLRNARFVVHEKGRQRCLEHGVRNVHAWVVGAEVERWHGYRPLVSVKGFRRAVYDPWKGGSFVDSETLEPVTEASVVMVSGKNVWYEPRQD